MFIKGVPRVRDFVFDFSSLLKYDQFLNIAVLISTHIMNNTLYVINLKFIKITTN